MADPKGADSHAKPAKAAGPKKGGGTAAGPIGKVTMFFLIVIFFDLAPIPGIMAHWGDGWFNPDLPGSWSKLIPLSMEWSPEQHVNYEDAQSEVVIVTSTPSGNCAPCWVALEDGSLIFSDELPAVLPDTDHDGYCEFRLSATVLSETQYARVEIAPPGTFR